MAVTRSQMYGHCIRCDVYNDTDADQKRRPVSHRFVFAPLLRIHLPVVNDKPSDRIRDSAANIVNSRVAE